MVTYLFKSTLLWSLLATLAVGVKAQIHTYSFTGVITDQDSNPVSGVFVMLLPDSAFTTTDSNGFFHFERMQAGNYTISCYATGYKLFTSPIALVSDKNVRFKLQEESNNLNTVIVTGSKPHDLQTLDVADLKGKELLQTRGKTLGESLKDLPGLNSIQTGPSLSKPVIHGLHSNRVLLINNGVRQQGQQWGTEHAPEIDPFLANKITVIKGAASVRYGSDAVAGVILLSPDELPTTKGISGNLYAIGASNGRMQAFSGTLQGALGKKFTGLSWRLQGTLKNAGNFKTPKYYLENTGLREGDFSAAIGYQWKRMHVNVYYSQFNNKLGIFSGAESGNLKELLDKFAAPVPATPSYFSYKIQRSYQVVNHELAKLNAYYNFKNGSKLELTVGRQNDRRREYDSDLPYNNNPAILAAPQLNFQLITHTAELIYKHSSAKKLSGSVGFSGSTSGNIFKGLRYLIPNFRDYNGGLFAIEQYHSNKLTLEAGIRYDYRWLQVYRRNATTLQVYHSTFQYQNVSGTVGATYTLSSKLKLNVNVGTAWRAPSINELYINGIHFSDASYQIGDSSLKSERAVNTSFSIDYSGERLRFNAEFYYNRIGNYIYEMPLSQPITTIGGVFPAFAFTQNDVTIKGTDISLQYDITRNLTLQSKTTLVRGWNNTIDNYLIYMPADRFDNGVEYHLPEFWHLQKPYLSVSNLSVLRQVRVPPNTDYVPTPMGYSLFNFNMGCTIKIQHKLMDINLSVNNLTNQAYRDYLNHFRYYADEIGRNIMLQLKYSF